MMAIRGAELQDIFIKMQTKTFLGGYHRDFSRMHIVIFLNAWLSKFSQM